MTCPLRLPSLFSSKRDWNEPPRIIKNVFAVLCWPTGVTLRKHITQPSGRSSCHQGGSRGPQSEEVSHTAPSSPPASAAVLPCPHLPRGRRWGGGVPGLQPLPWTLTHWPCGSCPFSLVGSQFQKSGGLCSRGGKEVCGGALWAHSGLGDPQGMVSPIAAWRGSEKKGG